MTGASGFIGSHVVERLLTSGTEVAILTRPSTDLWRLDHLADEKAQIVGDLADIGPIEDRLRTFAPDTVFHCAWSGVAGSQRNRGDQMNANVSGTAEIVELAQRLACEALIGIGERACSRWLSELGQGRKGACGVLLEGPGTAGTGYAALRSGSASPHGIECAKGPSARFYRQWWVMQ